MQATSTKQLMDQSKLFRTVFWGSIICMGIGTILCSIFPFSSCPDPDNQKSCFQLYSYFSQECINLKTYCCPSNTPSCSITYCIEKPTFSSECTGMLIAGATLLGIAGALAVIVVVMFCNFRARIKRGNYQNMLYQAHSAPLQPHYSPIIVYSNQPGYAQGRNAIRPINLSQGQ